MRDLFTGLIAYILMVIVWTPDFQLWILESHSDPAYLLTLLSRVLLGGIMGIIIGSWAIAERKRRRGLDITSRLDELFDGAISRSADQATFKRL